MLLGQPHPLHSNIGDISGYYELDKKLSSSFLPAGGILLDLYFWFND